MKNLSGLLAVMAFLGFLSIIQAQQNLLPEDVWTVGTGNIAGYSKYGTSDLETYRATGTNPFGDSNAVLWVSDPDGGGSTDGGFYSPYTNIDHTKTYRFTVWIKKTGSSSGTSYFGPFSRNTSQTWGANIVTTRLDGSLNTNPYFWFGDLPETNKWYLLVGYMHPNSYTGSSQGKMYDGTTFQEVSGTTFSDLKFGNGAIIMNLRSVLFGDTTNSNFQYYWKPTIHEADLTNPTLEAQKIQELLGQNTNVSVTGVSVLPSSASLEVGATQSLNATISPTGATDQSVSWSSNNGAIATVNNVGLVTAVSEGNAIITVTTTDGGFTANANINVTNSNSGGDFGSYKLYNATTNTFLNEITDGATYYIDEIGSNEITIEAVAPQSYLDATHDKKVRFNISTSGGADWLEGVHPYFMRGDNGNIYGGWIPPLNTAITFTISYYDNSTGTGTPIESDQFTLTFEPIAPTEPPAATVNEVSGTGVTNIFYNGQNIGIATNPQSAYRLAVEGSIRSREVKVDSDNWADYVFFDNYNLPTLQQVEQHIQEKGHLINIPSAAEVEENGIRLGEMNKLLLEKIEELTLYIIQQEKRIKQLEQDVTN